MLRPALASLVVLAGCATQVPGLEAPATMRLDSGAFGPGQPIPREHTCQGANVAPPLAWSGVPAGARTLAMVMDDPDATRGTFLHWTFWDLPASVSGLAAGANLTSLGAAEGANGAGRLGYTGPCPPTGTHRYFFRLYAVDATLDLPPGAALDQLTRALQGHLIAKGELMGTYARS